MLSNFEIKKREKGEKFVFICFTPSSDPNRFSFPIIIFLLFLFSPIIIISDVS